MDSVEEVILGEAKKLAIESQFDQKRKHEEGKERRKNDESVGLLKEQDLIY
jgi:hypothetical protein